MEKPDDLPSGTIVGEWYWGKSGRGKTHAAIEDFPNAYRKVCNNKWFDGYRPDEQQYILLDDLDKSHAYMGFHLKIWGDRYAFVAEIKGASLCIRPLKVVVTSNYHPRDIWSDDTTLEPILRRFQITQFCYEGEEPLNLGRNDYRQEHVRLRRPDSFESPPSPEVPPIAQMVETPQSRSSVDFFIFNDILN